MGALEQLSEAVIVGNRNKATELTQELLDGGTAPMTVVDDGLVPGMGVVGERFKNNEIFVPEMLIAARAMKQAMAIIEPLLAAEGIEPDHTVVVGTVQGDLHDIGKNLVAMMFKGANFGVVDVGTNVSADQFVSAVKESNADIVALSALLTTTMPSMKDTIAAMNTAGLDSVKIMIGGAPITQAYADEIGAHGYAPDAASAVDKAKELVTA